MYCISFTLNIGAKIGNGADIATKSKLKCINQEYTKDGSSDDLLEKDISIGKYTFSL